MKRNVLPYVNPSPTQLTLPDLCEEREANSGDLLPSDHRSGLEMAPALSSSSEVKVLRGQETDRVAGEEKLWTALSWAETYTLENLRPRQGDATYI